MLLSIQRYQKLENKLSKLFWHTKEGTGFLVFFMTGERLGSHQSTLRACVLNHFSCIQLCVTLRTVVHQAPLSMSVWVKVTQLHPTLRPHGLPGSSVHGILQARMLQWAAIPISRGSFWPRDQTQVCCIAGRFFMVWASWGVIYSTYT